MKRVIKFFYQYRKSQSRTIIFYIELIDIQRKLHKELQATQMKKTKKKYQRLNNDFIYILFTAFNSVCLSNWNNPYRVVNLKHRVTCYYTYILPQVKTMLIQTFYFCVENNNEKEINWCIQQDSISTAICEIKERSETLSIKWLNKNKYISIELNICLLDDLIWTFYFFNLWFTRRLFTQKFVVFSLMFDQSVFEANKCLWLRCIDVQICFHLLHLINPTFEITLINHFYMFSVFLFGKHSWMRWI